ncbi:hypothetical protein SAMN04515648_4527 [Phyllobacterium sp. CL33Tsu]|uniref:hypothetical protein n=1 Tax=Phyllobacterium sp. CL33Tsu TaxID=1798191 RepID=UPI0008E31483|nr:hypothetical protein [Phyllobacterium sp. CL33Tsu]SFJ54578.1 hypothetical protein SAMN04515648_4527 [Phyllobacterium sp. CL33Tsu]
MTTEQMISDWTDRNGGPRRFSRGESTDFLAIRSNLEKHGYKLSGHRYEYIVSKNGMSRRKFDWHGLLRFIDDLRVADGLPAILARLA